MGVVRTPSAGARTLSARFEPSTTDGGNASGTIPLRPALRWRIVSLLLVASILPLVVVGIGAFTVYGNLLKQRSLELQRTIVRNHANSIETYLFEHFHALDMLARSRPFEELSAQDGLQRAFDALSHTYSQAFVDLGVIGSDGAHLAYVGPYALRERNYAETDWFRSVMADGSYVSDVFLGFRQVPHCIVAVARQEGQRSWVVRATINSDKLESLVRTEQLGRRGDAYIVNAEGICQTAPKNGRVLERCPKVSPMAHSGVQDRRLTFEGQTIVQVTTWLNQNRWMLVVEQSEAEIQAPVHRATMWGVLVALLAMGLIVITTFLATWHLTSQIERASRERDRLSDDLLRSAKLASLGEMATGIAHEINNPLAIIMTEHTNIADVAVDLKDGDPIRREILESVQRAKKQVERCGGITAKMLQFGRALDTKPQPIDILPKIEEIVGLMGKQAQLRGVTIHVGVEPNLPKLVLDPVELQQVMVNLINNSLYAIDGTGEIRVAAQGEGRLVRLSVRDNGCGIPPENMGKVFQPFFTSKPVGRGTGLGLSVCYGIVHKWGGTIAVESEVGVGTEIIIRLPVPAGL